MLGQGERCTDSILEIGKAITIIGSDVEMKICFKDVPGQSLFDKEPWVTPHSQDFLENLFPCSTSKVQRSCCSLGSSKPSLAYTSIRPWNYPHNAGLAGMQNERVMGLWISKKAWEVKKCIRASEPCRVSFTRQCMELWDEAEATIKTTRRQRYQHHGTSTKECYKQFGKPAEVAMWAITSKALGVGLCKSTFFHSVPQAPDLELHGLVFARLGFGILAISQFYPFGIGMFLLCSYLTVVH